MSALTLLAFQRRPLLWLLKLAAHAHHPIAGLFHTHWAMLTLLDFGVTQCCRISPSRRMMFWRHSMTCALPCLAGV